MSAEVRELDGDEDVKPTGYVKTYTPPPRRRRFVVRRSLDDALGINRTLPPHWQRIVDDHRDRLK